MLTLISGTFENGCGVIVHDKSTDKFYHLIVYKNTVEIENKIYTKNDILKA